VLVFTCGEESAAYLRYWLAIHLERVVATRLELRVQQLLDRHGPQRVLCMVAPATGALLTTTCITGNEAPTARASAGPV
jgi:hypothetical protein